MPIHLTTLSESPPTRLHLIQSFGPNCASSSIHICQTLLLKRLISCQASLLNILLLGSNTQLQYELLKKITFVIIFLRTCRCSLHQGEILLVLEGHACGIVAGGEEGWDLLSHQRSLGVLKASLGTICGEWRVVTLSPIGPLNRRSSKKDVVVFYRIVSAS